MTQRAQITPGSGGTIEPNVEAGLRCKSGLSNTAILLQPTFDTVQVGQLGEKAQIWWYGANGERHVAMGPHASDEHFSIYTKADNVGDGNTALAKRLDINFGTTGDRNADVIFSTAKRFIVLNDGGTPTFGIGISPQEELHVGGVDDIYIRVESTGLNSDSGIQFHNDVQDWLLKTWGGSQDKFMFYDDTNDDERITIIPLDELVINDNGNAFDFRVEASGEPNALVVNGTTADVSIAGDRVVGTGVQNTTLGAGVTTFVASKKFIVLTGHVGTNTLATITGDMAFVGNEITILFVDGLVTITDTDAHTADTVDLVGAAADFTFADDTILKLVYDGSSWFETSRSVN